MVATTQTSVMDFEENYDEHENFERIQPKAASPMPAGSSRSVIKGQRRSRVSKKKHRAPQHCRGAAHRRNRTWR